MKFLALTLCLSLVSPAIFAEDESMKEKASEMKNDTKRGITKAGREVKEKTCEMVNGKMECTGKKIKNRVLDASDQAEDAMD